MSERISFNPQNSLQVEAGNRQAESVLIRNISQSPSEVKTAIAEKLVQHQLNFIRTNINY